VNILVATSSRYGATREIGDSIATELRREGHDVTVLDAPEVGDLSAHDAVVLGGAVYAGRWPRDGRELIERAGPDLAAKPLWIFSSGPVGEPPKPEGPPEGMTELLEPLGAREHVVFTGKLEKAHLRLGDKAIAMALGAPDGDFRDWNTVEEWAKAISRELGDLD
jgi:menaquinone-dependent protoporphyrinogen oxidase